MMEHKKKAFKALKRMNCPVFWDDGADYFRISAEHNFDKNYGDQLWADFYDAGMIDGYDFGVSPKINNLLRKHDLFAEWINAGELGVYDI